MKFTKRLVYGVGINDYGSNVGSNGKIIGSYYCWKEMLRRCYAKNTNNPTYVDCSVDSNWHLFSNFIEFYDKEYIPGYSLDKDLLVKGNRIYSKDTCCFVPDAINTLLIMKNKNSKYGGGVYYDNSCGKYRAKCSCWINGRIVTIGGYTCPIEAHAEYCKFKENEVKTLALEYYSRGEISEKIYRALLAWRVD